MNLGAMVLAGAHLMVAGMAAAQAGGGPLRVEVFVNSAMVLSHAEGATVYRLDGLQLLEDELSQGLPATEAAALPIARERVRRLGATLQQRAANASQGMVLAARYGIDRIPAVVIDGRALVYGMTDVAEAVAVYRRRRAQAEEVRR